MDENSVEKRRGLRPWTCHMVAALLVLGGFAGPAPADIYSYVDENGVRHYSNTPTSTRYQYAGPELERDAVRAGSPDRFDFYIRNAASLYDLEFALLKAMVSVESNFNPSAVSHAGAVGLMQIMPANFQDFELYDPFDPRENIMAGARYFKALLKRFENDTALSLAAYNAGPGTVERFEGIPPYEETRNYILRVMGQYDRFRAGESGT
jgi:soluble lytic murein transglycosylase